MPRVRTAGTRSPLADLRRRDAAALYDNNRQRLCRRRLRGGLTSSSPSAATMPKGLQRTRESAGADGCLPTIRRFAAVVGTIPPAHQARLAATSARSVPARRRRSSRRPSPGLASAKFGAGRDALRHHLIHLRRRIEGRQLLRGRGAHPAYLDEHVRRQATAQYLALPSTGQDRGHRLGRRQFAVGPGADAGQLLLPRRSRSGLGSLRRSMIPFSAGH